jgi:radical SAM protein with 4Fe4S-binding SPASM domain
MKAELKNRTYENREDLGKAAPLETPFVLMVDPSNLCNFRCKFCPSGNSDLIKKTGRKQCVLDFNLFKKIIDDLKEFNKPIKVLRLYKEGEPLVNVRFADMVKYAKDSGRVLKIDMTTNGALLNQKLNRQIIKAGLDRINISVNGMSSEQIKFNSGAEVNFEKYVENIRDLYKNKGNCEIYIKSIRQNLSPEEQDKFFKIFGEISDRIFLENLSPDWPEFQFEGIDAITSGNYGQPIINKKVCPYIFYMMVINSDGTTSLCVSDWKHDLLCGNVKKNSVKKIWLGEIMNQHRLSHLEGHRAKNNFCASCKVIHVAIANIDAEAEKIKKRLKIKYKI